MQDHVLSGFSSSTHEVQHESLMRMCWFKDWQYNGSCLYSCWLGPFVTRQKCCCHIIQISIIKEEINLAAMLSTVIRLQWENEIIPTFIGARTDLYIIDFVLGAWSLFSASAGWVSDNDSFWFTTLLLLLCFVSSSWLCRHILLLCLIRSWHSKSFQKYGSSIYS